MKKIGRLPVPHTDAGNLGVVYRRDGQVMKSAAFNKEPARAKQEEGFI